MGRIHKFFRLPPDERRILAQAWGFFLLADLALRILPFTRLASLSDRVFLKRKRELLPTPALSVVSMA